jgi:hypothetical protein
LPFGCETQFQEPTFADLPFKAVSSTECASEQLAGCAPAFADEVTSWETPPPKIGAQF